MLHEDLCGRRTRITTSTLWYVEYHELVVVVGQNTLCHTAQASYQSEPAATSCAAAHKALPLWGSLLLAKDRAAMEQLITRQTQVSISTCMS